jgi:hypothetical protein
MSLQIVATNQCATRAFDFTAGQLQQAVAVLVVIQRTVGPLIFLVVLRVVGYVVLVRVDTREPLHIQRLPLSRIELRQVLI